MMQNPTPSPFSFSEEPVGLSDEEELRRIGQFHGDGQGLGEVIVDYGDDFRELGIER